MSVGRELADARRRLGFSLEDVAARTKIKVERLRAIEATDPAQLPPPVYLRGFLREYAATVRLDPEETSERYLNELGNSTAAAALSTVSHPARIIAALPVGRASNSDADEQPFLDRLPDNAFELFRSELEDPPSRRMIVVEPAEHVSVELAPRPHQRHEPRRQRSVGAWLAVTAGLIGVAVGYVATTRPLPEPVSIADTSAPDAAPADEPGTPSAPAVDPPVSAPLASRPPEAAGDASAPAIPRDTTAGSVPPKPVAPGSSTRAADHAGAARDRAAGAVSPPSGAHAAPLTGPGPATPAHDRAKAARETETSSSAGRSLTGTWSLTLRVEGGDAPSVAPLNRGYWLHLRQEGGRITGSGQKWMENGRTVPPASRTVILVGGTLDGDRLTLQLSERGGSGDDDGTVELIVGPDGTLSGRFEGGANVRGRSVARRTGS
jgi:cytoskeleton protein RodZ